MTTRNRRRRSYLDESLTSAKAMGEAGVKAVGVPATIDNDIPGTELAIGVDTAIDTAVAALADGDHGMMVGVRGEEVGRVPLERVVGKERPLDPELYGLAKLRGEMPE